MHDEHDEEVGDLNFFGFLAQANMLQPQFIPFTTSTEEALDDFCPDVKSLTMRLKERISSDNEVEVVSSTRGFAIGGAPWRTLDREVAQLRSGEAQVAFGTELCTPLKDTPGCGPPIVIRHKSGLVMPFPAYRARSGQQAMITPLFRRHFTRIKLKPSFVATHLVNVLPVFSATASEIEISGHSYNGVLETIERRVSSLLKAEAHLVLTALECYGTGCSASRPASGQANYLTIKASSKWYVVMTLPCYFDGGEMTFCDSCLPSLGMDRTVVDDQDMFAKQFFVSDASFENQPEDLCSVSWALLPKAVGIPPRAFEDIQPVVGGTRVMLRFEVLVDGHVQPCDVVATPPRISDFGQAFNDVMTAPNRRDDQSLLFGVPCTARYPSDLLISPPEVRCTSTAAGVLAPVDERISATLLYYCGGYHVARLLKVIDGSGVSTVYFLHKYPTQDVLNEMLQTVKISKDGKFAFESSLSVWNNVFRTVCLYPCHVSWASDPASMSKSWVPIGVVGCANFGVTQCFLSLAFLAVLPVASPQAGHMPLIDTSVCDLSNSAFNSVLGGCLLTFPSSPSLTTVLKFASDNGMALSVASCTTAQEMIHILQSILLQRYADRAKVAKEAREAANRKRGR